MSGTPSSGGPPVAGPPRAARMPISRTHHGHHVEDECEWLRDRTDPAVMAHLEAENAWTATASEHLADLREELFQDFRARTRETDQDVPRRVLHHPPYGPRAYWYYTRTQEGLQYRVHCRIAAADGHDESSPPDPTRPMAGIVEQIVLDENVEARGLPFFSVGQIRVSPGGGLVAFLVDTTGGEVHRLVIRDLHTGADVGDPIDNVHYGLAWLGDDTIFYTVADHAWRPHRIRRRQLSTGNDEVVMTEDDQRFEVCPTSSRDGSAVLIASVSALSAEWRMLVHDDVGGQPRVITPRREGVDYRVEHAGDRLLILHNSGAEDFALAQAPLAATDASDWVSVIPHRPGIRLSEVAAYRGHVVLSVRRDGLAALEVISRTADGDLDASRTLAPARPLYTVWHEPGANTSDRLVRHGWSSLVTPPTIATFDTTTGEVQQLRTMQVRAHPRFGPYRSADHVELREWVTAPDGTRVPLSIVHRRGALDAGPAPTLLFGYGAYESSSDPWFDTERLALLDRGVIYAIAHVRGGGELGRQWYEQGRMSFKTNTFSDFVACSDHLIEQGYTTPDLLAAQGASAGGLLMGAVANLAPERFRAIHADVPFVDPLTTCLDPDFPLIVNEWEEWGDPLHDRDAYEYIASYAPYDNIRRVEYPSILATTSLNDIRVYYVEPAKWIARLRTHALNGPERPILLHTELIAGHGGASGRYGGWRQRAFEMAWLLDQLGLGPDHR